MSTSSKRSDRTQRPDAKSTPRLTRQDFMCARVAVYTQTRLHAPVQHARCSRVPKQNHASHAFTGCEEVSLRWCPRQANGVTAHRHVTFNTDHECTTPHHTQVMVVPVPLRRTPGCTCTTCQICSQQSSICSGKANCWCNHR